MTFGVPRLALALVETPPADGFDGPNLTLYLLTCALVIGAICGLGMLVRRVFARSLRTRAARRSLQVLDVLPLGGKQKLVVVRCYDRSFLLGLGDKEVRSIAELDAEEVESRGKEPAPSIVAEHPVRDTAAFEALLERNVPAAPEAGSTASTARPRKPRKPVLQDGRGILG